MSDWNSTALTPRLSAPVERAISGEEALACCLAEIQRLHNVIAGLSAEAADSRAKLAHATATLDAIINCEV
jgi:hypothetical protein